MNYLNDCIKKMEKEKIHPIVISSFKHYYELVRTGERGMLTKETIKKPSENNVKKYASLNKSNDKHLKKLAIVKLNGGLGTSMGLKKAKSLLPVKNNMSFLDIIAQQIITLRKNKNVEVPLIFMNSFNTQKDTLESLDKFKSLKINNIPLDFLQNKFPKLKQSDLSPLAFENEKLNWNPPGHGDIYNSLMIANIPALLLEQGFEYLFVSNSDNLGAIIDEKILTYFAEENIPFMMEVCERTDMDKKGGHLAETKTGSLILRESAQCPESEKEEFENIEHYQYFNTNNLWINLKALKTYYDENGTMNLPIIVNPKEVNEEKVFQLESAMGSAIALFETAKAIQVPRSRFVPVKKTDDLLLVWSDVFELNSDFQIRKSNEIASLPSIKLDPNYFKTIQQLQERIKVVPSLKNVTSLQIIGDVTINSKIEADGEVILKTESKIEI